MHTYLIGIKKPEAYLNSNSIKTVHVKLSVKVGWLMRWLAAKPSDLIQFLGPVMWKRTDLHRLFCLPHELCGVGCCTLPTQISHSHPRSGTL